MAFELKVLTQFEEWKYCIERKCKIVLTIEYVETRIKELSRRQSADVERFIQLYGENHLNVILGHFRKVQTDLGRR
jgi:L-fucose isomerase-like protein